MIRRLTKREVVIFVACLLVLLTYAGFKMSIMPLRKDASDLDRRIEKKRNNLRKNLRIIRKAELIGDEYDSLMERYRQTESNEHIMSSILSEIEEVAHNLDLRISDLKPQKVRSSDYLNHFSVSLTIQSEFVEIVRFLYLLQTEPHSFEVESVSFTKGHRRKFSKVTTKLFLSKVLIPQSI